MRWVPANTCGLPFLAVAGLGLFVAQFNSLHAQPRPTPEVPQPRVFIVNPPGGKAGSTVEVQVIGQDLDNAQGLLFNHPGFKAEVAGPATVAKIDQQPQRGGMGANATSIRFKVTIPADAPLGLHDLRLVNPWGVSNPRAFSVGDLAEALEKEPNNDIDQAQRVDLNSTVNGVISTATDVDYYVFAGKKGQRVVASCLAASLDSRLQPALQMYSKRGIQLAACRDYSGSDAVLDATLPDDGDYFVRVFSFTYTQGGTDYYYRLSISTAPWIDAVFPPMVTPGKENTLTVYGRNLPGGQLDPSAVIDGSVLEKVIVTVKVPDDPVTRQRLGFLGHVPPRSAELDGFAYTLKNEAGQSNPYLLTFARAPIVLDQGDNDSADKAQKITLPCEIAGRIEKPRDRDWYRFAVKKGETYMIEVFGDRLGSSVDMYFSLRPADGKGQVQEYDDNPELLHPLQFYSRTEDPQRLRFIAPSDGDYLLQVSSRDADVLAGPRQLYRVRITPEQPDFRLVIMPSSTKTPMAEVVHTGGSQYFTVLVARQDGFEGPITLRAEGLPPGVQCPPQTVGQGQRMGVLVVSANTDAAAWSGLFHVKGTASIDGQPVVREARPASIVWPSPQQQQNIPVLSRLDRGLALAVRENAPFALKLTQDKVRALAGERVSLALKVERLQADFKGPVTVTLVNWSPNQLTFNNNQPLTVSGDNGTGVLDVKNGLPPGDYTLALRIQAQVPFARDAAAKNKTPLTALAASVPITLTVASKDAVSGALAVTPGEVSVVKGGTGEVTVKVNRPGDLTGELKVTVVTAGANGVTVDDTIIPAGRSQAKVTIKVAKETNSGQRSLTIRVTGQNNSRTPVTHEGKVTVTVTRPTM